MSTHTSPVAASGTFSLGGVHPVHRLGFGAMRITGEGIWGPPSDKDTCLAVLRRAVELGVTFIDTADAYGPFVSEDLIREALHPYGDVLVATKGGLLRTGPGVWHPLGRPEYLRQCVEMSLRRLAVERIELWQLHRIDDTVPAEEQFGVIADMVSEGKIGLVGLSEVSVGQVELASQTLSIASVQNLYNLTNRAAQPVLDYCTAHGIAFIPWFPIATGELARAGGPLERIAANHQASPGQLALAWLLHTSPVVLPIPGTKSLDHLEENCAAALVELSDSDVATLEAV
jgi:aryl-alcohol dehydrogenase-like predicted oxidoreductase